MQQCRVPITADSHNAATTTQPLCMPGHVRTFAILPGGLKFSPRLAWTMSEVRCADAFLRGAKLSALPAMLDLEVSPLDLVIVSCACDIVRDILQMR